MARTTPRPRPTARQTLAPLLCHCPTCGNAMWAAYHNYNYRTITTLTDVLRLTREIRHCITPVCPQFRHPYRPEAEGRLALPKHEFGRDIIALIGTLRHAQHRSVPEIHQELARRCIAIAPRTVLHLLEPTFKGGRHIEAIFSGTRHLKAGFMSQVKQKCYPY